MAALFSERRVRFSAPQACAIGFGARKRTLRVENPMFRFAKTFLVAALALSFSAVFAKDEPAASAPARDAELARKLGADERGMRQYVLVILKTGPTHVPEGDTRKTMFEGHFANMQRLSKEGKLVLAGPFGDNPEGWRGLFVFAVSDIDEAKRLTATDPVIVNGEMVAEYHYWYGSAATMMIPELHAKIAPESP
jgi:uncharacterized protein YciI